MQWSEPAYVLSYRAHGERDAIVSVLARDAGRHVGLVRGGQSSKNKSGWQPGCLVNASWRARLPEHLGTITGEVVRDYGAAVLTSPIGLAAHLAALTLLMWAHLNACPCLMYTTPLPIFCHWMMMRMILPGLCVLNVRVCQRLVMGLIYHPAP